MIACLQGYNIYLQYSNYILQEIEKVNKVLHQSIDEEYNTRIHKKIRPSKDKNHNFKFQVFAPGSQTPRKAERDDSINLQSYNVNELREKGLIESSTDLVSLALQDLESNKGNTLNLQLLDSIFTNNLDESYEHTIFLLDKNKQVIKTGGEKAFLSKTWVVTKDYCVSLANPRFIRVAMNVPVPSFILHSIGTLVLSLLFVLIAAVCVAYQLKEIRWRTDLLENRETSVNGIIHDLKAPLNSIIMANSVIKNSIQDTVVKELLTTANRRAMALAGDIESILMAASSTTKRTILNYDTINLCEVANTVKAEIEDLYTDNSPIITVVDDTEQGTQITADKMYITNVFRNLLENAVKYADAQVNVNVHILQEKDVAKISVSDNGWGIAKRDLKNIFKQFYRVPHKHNPKGFGIGLALVKYVVSMHNGKIQVKSELGKGSTFSLTLPLNK